MTIVPMLRRPSVVARAAPATSHPLASADARNFRGAMRHLAGGVSVITTGGPGERSGLAATSVTSLSAEPPTLMFALNLTSSTFPVLRRHGAFAVNILAAGQQHVAERFAGLRGEKGEARYGGASWEQGAAGAWLLDGALAAFDCELEDIVERHTHAIVIGRVRGVKFGGDDAALIYRHGRYETLGERPEPLPWFGFQAF